MKIRNLGNLVTLIRDRMNRTVISGTNEINVNFFVSFADQWNPEEWMFFALKLTLFSDLLRRQGSGIHVMVMWVYRDISSKKLVGINFIFFLNISMTKRSLMYWFMHFLTFQDFNLRLENDTYGRKYWCNKW